MSIDTRALDGIEASATLLGMWAANIGPMPEWRTIAERDLDAAEAKLFRAIEAVQGARQKIREARSCKPHGAPNIIHLEQRGT